MFSIGNLVMPEPNRRQLRLDGAGRLTVLLQVANVGNQMLAGDVGQLLQMVNISEEPAEPLHGLVITLPCLIATLPVVSLQLVQLGQEGVIDALVLSVDHVQLLFQMGIVPPIVRGPCFRLISKERTRRSLAAEGFVGDACPLSLVGVGE